MYPWPKNDQILKKPPQHQKGSEKVTAMFNVCLLFPYKNRAVFTCRCHSTQLHEPNNNHCCQAGCCFLPVCPQMSGQAMWGIVPEYPSLSSFLSRSYWRSLTHKSDLGLAAHVVRAHKSVCSQRLDVSEAFNQEMFSISSPSVPLLDLWSS